MRIAALCATAILALLLVHELADAIPNWSRDHDDGHHHGDSARQSPTEPRGHQLVGFTTGQFAGDAGVLGMTRACQAEFRRSRFCTSEEVMATERVPDLDGQPRAWVRPVFVSAGAEGGQVVRVVGLDVSGVQGRTQFGLTCSGWSAAESNWLGLTVTADGGFAIGTPTTSCAAERPIACCARVGSRR